MTPNTAGRTVSAMQTYTTTSGRAMPKTPATAAQRVRLLLIDTGVRPPEFAFCVKSVATGRHLERVVVALPVGQFAEAATWFAKLCKIMPWVCRLTLIPEFGRIEISPRGQ